MNDRTESYREVFKDDVELSLDAFLRAMRKFDRAFSEGMAAGSDFTLKLEVRGDCHKMLHARVTIDQFDRPVEKSKKT